MAISSFNHFFDDVQEETGRKHYSGTLDKPFRTPARAPAGNGGGAYQWLPHVSLPEPKLPLRATGVTPMPLRTDIDMDRAQDTAARAAALIKPRTLPKAGAALPSIPPAYQPGQNQLALPTASEPLVSPTGMIGSTGIRLPSAKPAQQRVPVGNTGVRLPAIAGESEYKGALAVPSRPEGAPIATAGKWVARNTMAGIGAVNSGLAKTADMILPDVITPGPIQKVINRYKGETDRYQPAAQEINRETGTEMLGSLYQGTVAALPNAAMAVMSSGTSAAPQLGPQAAGLMSTISTSLKQLARNPMFWTSFAQTSGATYEDAKEQGASELEAQATALISGVLNAGVEVSGGIETFGQNGTGVAAWVRTMLDEGKEEVVQGAIEQLTKKAIYRPELPYHSAENPEAVINLPRAAQEFGGGAAVGGILGGGQIMAGAALGALRGTGIETDTQTVRPDPNPEMRGIMAEEFGRGNAIRETYEPQTPLLPAGAQMENGRIVLPTAQTYGGLPAGNHQTSAGEKPRGKVNIDIEYEGPETVASPVPAGYNQIGGVENGRTRASERLAAAPQYFAGDGGGQTQRNPAAGIGTDRGNEAIQRSVYEFAGDDGVPQAVRIREINPVALSQRHVEAVRTAESFGTSVHYVDGEVDIDGQRLQLPSGGVIVEPESGQIFASPDASEEAILHDIYHPLVKRLPEYAKRLSRTLALEVDQDGAAFQAYWMRTNKSYGKEMDFDSVMEELSADVFGLVMKDPQEAAQRLSTFMGDPSRFGRIAGMVQQIAQAGRALVLQSTAKSTPSAPEPPKMENAFEVQRAVDREIVGTTAPGDVGEHLSTLSRAYRELDAATRNRDRMRSRLKLTDTELEQARQVSGGMLDPDSLAPGTDRAKVLEYAAALAEVELAEQPLRAYRAERAEGLDGAMQALVENSDSWKDKLSGFQYARETMERNIRDIVPDKAEAERIISEVFEPVHLNEAKRQRFLNRTRGEVEKLGLSHKESEFVQLLGERVISETQIPEGYDRVKIRNAVTKLRDEIYPALLEQVNEVLVLNGYKPVKPRKDYFPHFNEPGDPLVKGLRKLGINITVDELPTDISGLTHTFKPGKQWFGSFLHRTGNGTIYDAVRGFDQYIEGISNVIYHTDDIQRLRAFERSIRGKYSEAAIADQIAAIKRDARMGQEEKDILLDELYGRDVSHLPKFVTELRSYTDSLAGKKAIGDRQWEHDTGRAIYSSMKALENRVAANMVAVNPGSWLTNFIPLAQGSGELSTDSFFKGMRDTLKSMWQDDGFVDSSTFLTNRRGSDRLYKTGLEEAQEMLSRPMTWIDDFTSNVLTRAKFYENVKSGMDSESALRQADGWAASVIADRSKGSLPTLFERRNPVAKVFTMYQVEVNNQLSYLFKDVPRAAKGEGMRKLAAMLAKYAIASYLYNDLYEKLVGRRPALDGLGILNEAVGDFAGYQLPNTVDLVVAAARGRLPSFQTEAKKPAAAGSALAKNVAEELPFIGGLLGGGRVPISSALPNVGNLWNAAAGGISGDIPANVAQNRIGRELMKPLTYVLPPVGGGQIKKLLEGVGTVNEGGAYGLDNEGNRVLRFPVFDRSPLTYAKGALFGKYALPMAQQYVDSGFKTLPAKLTAGYDTLVAAGIDSRYAYDSINDLRGIKPDKDGDGKVIRTSTEKKQDYIYGMDIPPKLKPDLERIVLGRDEDDPVRNYGRENDYIISGLPESQQKTAKELMKYGISPEKYISVMEGAKDIQADRDWRGEPISGSKKKKVCDYIDHLPGLTGTMRKQLKKAMGYSS